MQNYQQPATTISYVVYIGKNCLWCKHLLKLLTVLDTLRPDLAVQTSWYFSEQLPDNILKIPSVVALATNTIMSSDEAFDFILSLMMTGQGQMTQQQQQQQQYQQQQLPQQFQQRQKAKAQPDMPISATPSQSQSQQQRTNMKNQTPGPECPPELAARSVDANLFSHNANLYSSLNAN